MIFISKLNVNDEAWICCADPGFYMWNFDSQSTFKKTLNVL